MLPEALPTAAPIQRSWSLRVIEEQAREIISRCRWDILAFVILVWSLHVVFVPMSAGLDRIGVPFSGGRLNWPYAILMPLFAALWALRIWTDMPMGARDHFLAKPVDRTRLLLCRVIAGMAILVAVFVLAWALGGLLADATYSYSNYKFRPRYLQTVMYQRAGWFWTIGGMANAYLFATIFALRFRHPERWILLWLPLGCLLVVNLSMFVGLGFIGDSLASLIDSLIYGFGYASMVNMRLSFAGFNGGLVLLWFAILSVGVVLAARLPERVRR